MDERTFLEAVQGPIDRTEAADPGMAPGGLEDMQREVLLRVENLRTLQAALPPRAT